MNRAQRNKAAELVQDLRQVVSAQQPGASQRTCRDAAILLSALVGDFDSQGDLFGQEATEQPDEPFTDRGQL